ncbi:RNA-directed DNA polymerase, eukaryota, reverse transcriptase zinc-binding domain protein [Tanacetum coccineum]|uniref:RNA-directed DNA polymerase, eukaryota, reverse transcriptase zinc-binding domain protein n=1 Tax=Tanacetum coccineum TaxID=301880 RepID=A0ABQ5AW79_9ASTR
MCFVDDLMVLCNRDKESLIVVKKSLEEFNNAYGLFRNLSKSVIFFRSINEGRKDELLEVLPFKCGKHPMKYLGVPLISKKIGINYSKSLIDNVKSRISCWRNKFLSCASRIQLIALVLFAMQQYWASVYMLLTTVIKELEKLFKRFLWNAGNLAQGKARVAWNLVRRHKDQGGLSIKPLKRWNVGFSAMEDYLKKRVFVGEMDRVIPKRALYEARMKNNDIVIELSHDGLWMWPSEWSRLYPALNQLFVPNLSQRRDTVLWIDGSDKEVEYLVGNVWKSLRDK